MKIKKHRKSVIIEPIPFPEKKKFNFEKISIEHFDIKSRELKNFQTHKYDYLEQNKKLAQTTIEKEHREALKK